MHQNNSQFIFCVKCKGKLNLEVLHETTEITEGFLHCKKCHSKFPIILKIPIMMKDLSQFLGIRSSLGGFLLKSCITKSMKDFLKHTMSKIQKPENDYFQTEKRWTKIYQSNRKSSFYKIINAHLSKIPPKNFVVEYGASIGIISNSLGLKHQHVFGIDTSFSALLEAKMNSLKNCEYILSDILQHPLGKKKFDLIIALNLFELVEPSLLLKTIFLQISNGLILLSDPYDYERGKNSVNVALDENQIREIISKNNFKITKTTQKPSKINWNLRINERTSLNYKVDIILARKFS